MASLPVHPLFSTYLLPLTLHVHCHCLCADHRKNVLGSSLLVFPTAFWLLLLVKTLDSRSPTVAPCAVCCVVSFALQLDKFLCLIMQLISIAIPIISSAGMQPSRRLIKPSRLAPKPSSSCLRLLEAHPGYVSFKMLLGESAGSYGGKNNEKRSGSGCFKAVELHVLL